MNGLSQTLPVTSDDLRSQLRTLFTDTLNRVQIMTELQQTVRCDDGVLTVGELRYRLAEFDRIVLVSIGKASVPMCNYFVQTLQPELANSQKLEGIAVGSALSYELPPQIRFFHGSHPVPDASSRNAAAEIMRLLNSLDERSLVLFLISGGGSAMVEQPMPEISVEETAAFYRGLLHSGLSIVEMNALRKHFSAVKGGRLAEAAGAATQCTVLVSDVPDGFPHMVSSGPTLPDPSTREECAQLLRSHNLERMLPAAAVEYLLGGHGKETPKESSAIFDRARWVCLLSNEHLLRCAAARAEMDGYTVVIDNCCDDWPYRKAAEYLLGRLRELARVHERVCLLSGGEVSVEVSGAAGTGGRNQHFALYCATQLDEYFQGQSVAVLSAGSDGIDGNSASAGAVVDGTTMQRTRDLGIDPMAVLLHYDSGSLFEALGDAIVTGPTGNNLRDIRMLVSTR